MTRYAFTHLLIGEKARITAAGGFVDFGRVNGNLALSRAIGDFEFKKSAELSPEQQIVTVYPDVTVHDVHDDDEFLVVACDGNYAVSQSWGLTNNRQVFGTVSPLRLSSSSYEEVLSRSRSCQRFART